MTTAQLIIFCFFYPSAFWQDLYPFPAFVKLGLGSHLAATAALKRQIFRAHQRGSRAAPVGSATGTCPHLRVLSEATLCKETQLFTKARESLLPHYQATTKTGRELLRAELTSWILQIGLSWMKDSGQHCLSGRAVRQNLLPRHMKAIHSIKPIWTLIFKHTFKLSHIWAAASQATFYIIRNVRCWLKIWQRKPLRLADLTSAVPDPQLRTRQPD